MRVLSRTWQMLLKGIAEVGAAGRPLAAAEMVLVRIAYAADLPTPEEVIRSFQDNGSGGRAQDKGGPTAVATPASSPMLEARRLDAPKVEAARTDGSRGGLRSALAPVREPMVGPGAAEPSSPRW